MTNNIDRAAECKQCRNRVDEDGFTPNPCPWGPDSCRWCGSCYCDWSC